MELELKPCPFCGSHAESHYTHGIWVFRCVECGAISPTTGDNLPTKDTQISHAAEAWNTRPIEDALRAENLGLAKSLLEAEEEVERLNGEMLQKTQQVSNWEWMHSQRKADYQNALATIEAVKNKTDALVISANAKARADASQSAQDASQIVIMVAREIRTILSAAPTKGEKG